MKFKVLDKGDIGKYDTYELNIYLYTRKHEMLFFQINRLMK